MSIAPLRCWRCPFLFMTLPHHMSPLLSGPSVFHVFYLICLSHICVIQEQVVVSPSSKLREARSVEVKSHMAQLVLNPDSLTPVWPPPRPYHCAVC